MYLVADSGATKCDWALVAESGVQRLRTRGLNPAVQEAAYMRRVLASELGADAAPEAVWFYGAGCSARFPEATALMRTLLGERFPSARIGVESDLLGAARALFADGGGIACILGTGSNSGWYDGRGIVRNVPPLGYVLGDEGSGAAIGRELLRGVLRETLPPGAVRPVLPADGTRLRAHRRRGLPGRGPQPLSGIARAFRGGTYRAGGDTVAGAGRFR